MSYRDERPARSFKGLIFAGIASVGIMIMGFSSTFIINEGNVGVKTHMGQAVGQLKPAGLQFKAPFIQGIQEFDVRERVITGTLNAATSNQLVTNMTYSVNWRPDPDQIMNIYINYGSPQDFASNTIVPRLNQSLKAVVGKYTGAQLTRNREEVANAMLTEARRVLDSYPAIFNSVQVENFSLPDRYMNAVLDKEEQREATEKEQLLLEQQDIASKQEVQTANADRDARKARADGQAYETETLARAEAEAIRIKAEAEADGIRAIEAALQANPLLVQYEQAKRWSGNLPMYMVGGGEAPSMLMQLPAAQ